MQLAIGDLDDYLNIYDRRAVIDRTFKALADPSRRRMLALLRDTDLAAGDIAAHFDMAFASVSHHLQVLRDSGLVLSKREGQRIIYSLNTTVFQDALQHLLDIAPSSARAKTPRKRATPEVS